ncbi:MAG: metallophosphoesterase [Fibrobacter sp.]|nr:metallophosphoesterase [Fibrobacter sp.]
MQFLFLGMVLSILVGSHFYIAKRFFAFFSWTGGALKIAWLIMLVLLLSVVVAMLLSRSDLLGNFFADKFIWLGFVWFGFMFLFTIATFASDLVGCGIWLAAKWLPVSADLWIPRVRIAFYGITLILGVTALIEGAKLPKIEEIPVSIANLPQEFEGYRIAHLTDTHIGPILRESWAQQLVEITNSAKPDLIVHSGDIIDGSVEKVGPMVRPLTELRAPDGVLFVSGNHEVYSLSKPWLRHLKSLGLYLLDNKHIVVKRGESSIVVAGISDKHSGKDSLSMAPDPGQAFKNAPPAAQAPRIFLAHQPNQAESAQGYDIALQLSGHTHGGQFWPFHHFIYLQQPIRAGFGKIGDIRVFVSNGAGFWGPPMRLFAPAHIPVLVLQRG